MKKGVQLKWYRYFLLGNIIAFWLISLRYLLTLSWIFSEEYKVLLNLPYKIALLAYLAISYFGHLAVLAFLPTIIIILVIFILPIQFIVMTLAILLTTLCNCLLLLDTLIYNQFHYHLNGIVLALISDSMVQEVDLLNLSSHEIMMTVGIVLSIFLLEIIFAIWLWKRSQLTTKKSNYAPCVMTFITLCVLISYGTYIPYAKAAYLAGEHVDKNFGHALIETSRILPFYNKLLGGIALDRISGHKFMQPTQAQLPLNYPINAMKFSPSTPTLNLVIIVIDAWRFDMLNPKVTPNLHQFSKEAWIFENHFSGGNATGPGIHSLFYSILPNYATALKEQQKGPVLIDEFLRRNYKLNILASAGLSLPDLSNTVFQNIENLQTSIPGENAHLRDCAITKSFQHFLKKNEVENKPFFSFLFYDSAHAYCQIPNTSTPFSPCIGSCNRFSQSETTETLPYLNRYKNALYAIDAQIKEVINSLKEHKLLETTIVIITGDHGEEFNDNKKGYFGHTSNFTHFQVQTPLIIYWPSKKPETFTHITSHYDIAPTLMEKMLGCLNSPNDYSSGKPLQNPKAVDYLMVGSYIGTGIIEKNQITSIYPSGDFEIYSKNAEPLPNATLNPVVIQKVLHEMNRFYK